MGILWSSYLSLVSPETSCYVLYYLSRFLISWHLWYEVHGRGPAFHTNHITKPAGIRQKCRIPRGSMCREKQAIRREGHEQNHRAQAVGRMECKKTSFLVSLSEWIWAIVRSTGKLRTKKIWQNMCPGNKKWGEGLHFKSGVSFWQAIAWAHVIQW